MNFFNKKLLLFILLVVSAQPLSAWWNPLSSLKNKIIHVVGASKKAACLLFSFARTTVKKNVETMSKEELEAEIKKEDDVSRVRKFVRWLVFNDAASQAYVQLSEMKTLRVLKVCEQFFNDRVKNQTDDSEKSIKAAKDEVVQDFTKEIKQTQQSFDLRLQHLEDTLNRDNQALKKITDE